MAMLPPHKSPSWHLNMEWCLWRLAAGAWLAERALLLYFCFLGLLPVMMAPHRDFGAGPLLPVGWGGGGALLRDSSSALMKLYAVCVSLRYALSFLHSSLPRARPVHSLTAFLAPLPLQGHFPKHLPCSSSPTLPPASHRTSAGTQDCALSFFCAFAPSRGTFSYVSAWRLLEILAKEFMGPFSGSLTFGSKGWAMIYARIQGPWHTRTSQSTELK